jgi:hypothetical protein
MKIILPLNSLTVIWDRWSVIMIHLSRTVHQLLECINLTGNSA